MAEVLFVIIFFLVAKIVISEYPEIGNTIADFSAVLFCIIVFGATLILGLFYPAALALPAFAAGIVLSIWWQSRQEDEDEGPGAKYQRRPAHIAELHDLMNKVVLGSEMGLVFHFGGVDTTGRMWIIQPDETTGGDFFLVGKDRLIDGVKTFVADRKISLETFEVVALGGLVVYTWQQPENVTPIRQEAVQPADEEIPPWAWDN